MPLNFDVVILGGGPAGTSTAISLLQQKGYSVALIERSQYDKIRYGETLVPIARKLLVELDVWEQFLLNAHRKSYCILSAWGKEELYENNFIFNPFGNGWHLDRVRFDAMLMHAAEKAGVLVLRGAQIIKCFDSAKGQWNLSILIKDQLHQFRSRFLVDATGRSSFIARKKGAKRILSDHLIGVVAFFHTNKQTSMCKGYTLIEAQESGWWYSAELPTCRTALVFMTDADIYARALKLSPDFWQEQLNSSVYTKARFGSPNTISNPKPVASYTSRIYPVAGTNWLAVGDAAMSFDPLSSQGIYKAIESGISAAKSIHDTFINKRNTLESYSRSVDGAFEKYMSLRRLYYLKEQRWPESSFWKRRHLD